jgi:hypothetical protein
MEKMEKKKERGRGEQSETMEGVNSTTIYLICFKNFVNVIIYPYPVKQ